MKLTEIEKPANLSDKEFIRWLGERSHVTRIQMRAMAHRLNKGDSVAQVLKMADTGKLPANFSRSADPQAKGNLPRYRDIPQGLGPKQGLLFLRDAGSISPVQTRRAAQAINAGKSLDQALADAGVEHLLDVVPKNTKPKPEPKKEAPKEDGAPHPPPVTLGAVLAKNIPEIKDIVAGMENPNAVLQLLREEAAGKDRSGAVNALIDRAAALGASEVEIAAALSRPEEGEATLEAMQKDFAGD